MAKASDNTNLSNDATAAFDCVEDEQHASDPCGDSAAAAALSVGGSVPAALPSERGRKMQRLGIALVAAASVILIGASAFSLVNGQHEEAAPGVLETTVEASADSAPDAGKEVSAEAPESSGSSDAESGVSAEGAEASAASSDPSSVQSPSSASDSAVGGSSAGTVGAPSSSGSGTVSSGGSSSESAPAPAPNTVTVQVSVSSSAVGGSVSGSGTFTFEQGATVYDALCALGLSVNARDSAMGIYVAGIGGLAEKQHGPESGWKYSVNGSDPGMSCGAYTLHDGDVVAWRYVTSLNG